MERYVYYTGPECVCCADVRKKAAKTGIAAAITMVHEEILRWGFGSQAHKILRDLVKTLEKSK